MSKNKGQHYLPAFYIYNFTNEVQKAESEGRERRETKVFHYDFAKDAINEKPIRKIAKESYLLSYKDDEGKYNHALDDRLKVVENSAARAFQELDSIYKHISKRKPRSVTLSDDMVNDVLDLLVWQIEEKPGSGLTFDISIMRPYYFVSLISYRIYRWRGL